jgi:hypothetical protein
MINKIAIAVLFSTAALLTPAHATTVLFNTTGATKSYNNTNNIYSVSTAAGGTITAYGYDGIFLSSYVPQDITVAGGSPTAPNNDGASLNPVQATKLGTSVGAEVTSAGLGVTGSTYIGPSDAVVLDFANVSSTVKQDDPTVTFNMKIDATGPSDWVVYGFSNGQYVFLGDGAMSTVGAVSFQQPTTGLYSYYLIGVANDCDLSITGVSISYNGQTTQTAPEPGTFLMAGMALVAAGVTMKKRARKA